MYLLLDCTNNHVQPLDALFQEEKEQLGREVERLRAEVNAGRCALERAEVVHAEAVRLLQDASNEGRLQRDRNMDLEVYSSRPL